MSSFEAASAIIQLSFGLHGCERLLVAEGKTIYKTKRGRTQDNRIGGPGLKPETGEAPVIAHAKVP